MSEKWLRLKTPRIFCNSITDIDFAYHASQGRRYWLFDLDNTLAAHGVMEAETTFMEKLKKARESGDVLGLCIITNQWYKSPTRLIRIEALAKSLSAECISCYWPNLKPKAGPFLQALKKIGGNTENSCMVGDNVHLDIYGANRLKIFSIQVKPLGPDKFKLMKFIDYLVW